MAFFFLVDRAVKRRMRDQERKEGHVGLEWQVDVYFMMGSHYLMCKRKEN